MKYYTYQNSKSYKDYIIEEIPVIEMALICFDDNNKNDFIKIVADNNADFIESRPNDCLIFCVGEDNFMYSFRLTDGERVKVKRFSLKKYYKFIEKQKEYAKYTQGTRKLLEECQENTIITDKTTSSRYKKYSYIDKQGGQVFKFRFKQVKSDKQLPLLVYFHGAGCLGYDNEKQKLEYMFTICDLMPEKCNILLPQANYFDNQGVEKIDKYTNGVKLLIDDLILKCNIDTNRIYIVGTSFGGGCLWRMLYNYPNLFAGGIPVMGDILINKLDEKDIVKFSNQNIWMAHSSNDNNVLIDSDDKVYAKLKNSNCNIKYTRWNKLGHSMSWFFYTFKSWKKWLFKQSLN